MNRIDICRSRLGLEESRKRFAYNDKTGKRVTCISDDPETSGNLSIAIGVNLEVGLDDEEIDWLLDHRLTKTDQQLRRYSWYSLVDETRGSVFLDVGFNDGVTGLLHFPRMILAASIKNWNDAADELLDSEAARADPNRYRPLAQILRTGIA